MQLYLSIVALNDILYIYSMAYQVSTLCQKASTDRKLELSKDPSTSTMSTIITTWVLEGVSSNVKPTENYYLTPKSFFSSMELFSHRQVIIFCFPAPNLPLLVHSHSIHFSVSRADGCFKHYTTALHHMEDRQS